MTDLDMKIDEALDTLGLLSDARNIRAAIDAAGLAIVPQKPTKVMIDALYGRYLSLTADKIRLDSYRAMLAAAEAPSKGPDA